MRRAVDLRCNACETERYNVICGERERIQCPTCAMPMEQCWWGLTRSRVNAQWDDNTAVMVHVTRDPSVPPDVRIRYPGHHDAILKSGYERIYLRSKAEVDRFERAHHVACHVMHYDSNGRALDDKYRNQSMNH